MSLDFEIKSQLLLELGVSQMYDKDMNRMGQYVLDDSEPEPESFGFHIGDYVAIDTTVGGGKGKITQISEEGTHAVVKLLVTDDSDMDVGDTVAVELDDAIKLSDDDLNELENDLNFEEGTDKFNVSVNDYFNNVNDR
jgi:hypothetical protein